MVKKNINDYSETTLNNYQAGALNHVIYMSDKEYDAYLNNLIQQTGIDVYKISKSEALTKVLDKTMISFKVLNESTHLKSPLPYAETLTEEKIEQLRLLAENMDAYYSQGDEYNTLLLYVDFCSICNTIDGFTFNTSNYGVQTIDFDENSITYPTVFLQEEVDNAASWINEISEKYPVYKTLPEDKQQEILAASATIKIKQEISERKYYSEYDDCKEEAVNMFALSMGAATACYETALIGCAFTVVGAPGCIAIASSTYAVACAVAAYQYHRAIKRCEENQ